MRGEYRCRLGTGGEAFLVATDRMQHRALELQRFGQFPRQLLPWAHGRDDALEFLQGQFGIAANEIVVGQAATGQGFDGKGWLRGTRVHRQRFVQDLAGDFVLAQRHIDIADLIEHGRGDIGLIAEIAGDASARGFEQFTSGGVLAARAGWIGVEEHRFDETADCLGALQGDLGACRFGGLRACLRQGHAAGREQAQQADEGDRHADPVATDELAGAIGEAIGPRADGLASEMIVHVLGQRQRRGVAALRLDCQRPRDDGIEITAQERCRH